MIPTAALTITEFLEARITEDEVAATLRECHREDCGWIPNEAGYSYPCGCGVPERMAAECAAKREVVTLHHQGGLRMAGFPRADREESYCVEDQSASPCGTLRALAAVYKDHPDCRREWV